MKQTGKQPTVVKPLLSIKETIPIYREMLTKNPDSFIFLPLAELYRQQGYLNEAIRLCQEGLAKYPHYYSAKVSLAMAYYHSHMSKEAQKELEKVIEVHPDNILAHRVLAHILLKAEKTKEALEHFDIILSFNPYDSRLKSLVDELRRKVNLKVAEGEEEVRPLESTEAVSEEVVGPETVPVPLPTDEANGLLELNLTSEIPLTEPGASPEEEQTLDEEKKEGEVGCLLSDEKILSEIEGVTETDEVPKERVLVNSSETSMAAELPDAHSEGPTENLVSLAPPEHLEISPTPALNPTDQEIGDHELAVSDLTSPPPEARPEEQKITGRRGETAKKTMESWLQNINKAKERSKDK